MNASRVVVVTGASGGLGRATARRFAEQGAAVALLARGEKGLAGAAEEVVAAGGRALPVPVDVADRDQVFAAAARVEDELGPIDTWVNAAFSAVIRARCTTSAAPQQRPSTTGHPMINWMSLEQAVLQQRGTSEARRGPVAPRREPAPARARRRCAASRWPWGGTGGGLGAPAGPAPSDRRCSRTAA